MPASVPSAPPAAVKRFFPPPWSWSILVSVLAWTVVFIAVPPRLQNFPLGDDWAFAHGAVWFAQGQGIHYSNWASMPQLGQWIWSWPFLHLTGLAHVALRISVIVLSWLGLAAFHDLLRRENISAQLAAFAACVLALDPLWFVSQGTYMTDVPALSFGLLALCFFSRALDTKNPRWLLSAAVLMVFAVVTRQTMLAVPVAAGLMLWRNREIRWKPAWIFSVVAPAVVCAGTAWWFARRPDVLPMPPEFDFKESLVRAFIALHLCGLAVLPLALLVFRPRRWRIFFAGLAVMMIAADYFRFAGGELPFGGLFPYCTGMLSLEGTYSDGLVVGQRDILLTPFVRTALTVFGCVGAAEILTALVETVRAKKWPGMLVLFTLLQFLVILTLPSVTDRYLEVLFPGAIFLVAARSTGSRLPAGVVAMVLYGLISVALVHDWLAWNSARWELGRQAIAAKKIPASDIEGGMEWNGWFASADFNKLLSPAKADFAADDRPSLVLPFTRYFFPQVTGQFALAFTAPEGSVVVASQPYSTWLPPATRKFLLIRLGP
jgi:hypothetical protein